MFFSVLGLDLCTHFCMHFKSQLATGRLQLLPLMQQDNILFLSISEAPWGKGWYWFWVVSAS